MYNAYEIKKEKGESVLYLYGTYSYEFANEFTSSDEIGKRTNQFIQDHKIPFRGNKVYLVVDGIVIKSIDISKYLPEYSSDISYSPDQFMVFIRYEDNVTIEVSLREYLYSILFSYYDSSIEKETLKAICVLYNTYVYSKMREDGFVPAISPYSHYEPLEVYQKTYSTYSKILSLFDEVILDTEGVYVTYEGNYILPFIHYSNSGKTLTHSNYPYLSSVKSLWDMESPYYTEIHSFSYEVLEEFLSQPISSKTKIQMIEKDHIKKLVIENRIYTLEEIKQILSLKSTDFYLIQHLNKITIITKGYGNSLGLSIFGSNEIAKDGFFYYHILSYYFPKTKLYRHMKKLS